MKRHLTAQKHDNNGVAKVVKLVISVVIDFPEHLAKVESRVKVKNGVVVRHSYDNCF